MLWKEITVGFLLAGYLAQFGNGFFEHLFISHAPQPLPTIENVVIGPIIAVLSFVCSVGNVPLAAVPRSGGISFAGVLAFLFADLVVLPILAIYRKYYGTAFAVRIAGLMFTTMVLAALVVYAETGAWVIRSWRRVTEAGRKKRRATRSWPESRPRSTLPIDRASLGRNR
ncbi:MAG: permease [Actinomycetota bacterium]|nr:permease [Actinomycetota bacterium]